MREIAFGMEAPTAELKPQHNNDGFEVKHANDWAHHQFSGMQEDWNSSCDKSRVLRPPRLRSIEYS